MATQQKNDINQHRTEAGAGSWIIGGLIIAALIALGIWWLFYRSDTQGTVNRVSVSPQPTRNSGQASSGVTSQPTSTVFEQNPGPTTSTETGTSDSVATVELPPAAPLTDGKTYRSSQTNVTFMYPATWKLEEESTGFTLSDLRSTTQKPYALRYIKNVQSIGSGSFRVIGKAELTTTNADTFILAFYRPTGENRTLDQGQRMVVVANKRISGSLFFSYNQATHPQALAQLRAILESVQITQ